jgi:RNA recognition motif-containing protein
MGEDELKEFFSSCGKVSEASVVHDRETGRSRGFGFVTFFDEFGAQEAIRKLNGSSMGGRSLMVNMAEDRKFNTGRSQTAYRSPHITESLPSSSTQRVRTVEFGPNSPPGGARRYGNNQGSDGGRPKPNERRQRRQNNYGFEQD